MKDFAISVRAAAARSEVRNAVGAVYADLQAQIEQRRPVCTSSGRCCRFDEYGHRLYVTTLEVARFVFDLERNGFEVTDNSADREIAGISLPMYPPASKGCPYQRESLCGVHSIRPFGCQIYFCDESSTQWQHDHYERFHARLRALHEELEVPYFYVEWRKALAAMAVPMNAPVDRSLT